MMENYVDISGRLFRDIFTYQKDLDTYRIQRPTIDVFVDMLSRQLACWKQYEKREEEKGWENGHTW